MIFLALKSSWIASRSLRIALSLDFVHRSGVAAVMQISGKEMAKTVVLRAGERGDETILAVLPGPRHVNSTNCPRPSASRCVWPLSWSSALSSRLRTRCHAPFGSLYDLPIYVDESLAQDVEIVFNAGTHHDAVRLRYDDFLRLANPTVCSFA